MSTTTTVPASGGLAATPTRLALLDDVYRGYVLHTVAGDRFTIADRYGVMRVTARARALARAGWITDDPRTSAPTRRVCLTPAGAGLWFDYFGPAVPDDPETAACGCNLAAIDQYGHRPNCRNNPSTAPEVHQ